MAYALNNVTTQDDYAPKTTLSCPGAHLVNIDVGLGAAIYYQLGEGVGAAVWGVEVFFLGGGGRSMARRCDAVRVRSAVRGKPAQVTITATAEGGR